MVTKEEQARRVPVLIASVLAIATLCWSVSAVLVMKLPVPSARNLLICFFLILAGSWLHLPIRLGAQRVELSWSEASLVIALTFIPANWIVLLTPVAVGISLAQRRLALVKTAYNAAADTIAATTAAGVIAVVGVDRPFLGVELLTLLAAGTLAGLVTYVAVAAVIAAVQDVSLLATWRVSGGLQVFTLAGNLAVAVGVVVLVRYQPTALSVAPIVGLCLHQGYVGRLRGHQEREAGQRHAAAVGRLTTDLDELGVLHRAAEGACRLVSADAIDVDLPAHGTSSPAVIYRYRRNGETWTGDPADAPALPTQLVATLPIPTTDDQEPGQLRVWLASTSTDIRLGDGEQAALDSLATHTGAAVANARLHAQQTYYATHDRLTGLPARPLLVDQIESAFRAGAGRTPTGGWQPTAVLVLAITGYTEIVGTVGHDVAEELLVRTARRLRATADPGEYVAHLGESTFAVYLPAAVDPAHVRARGLRLVDAVGVPHDLAGAELVTSQVTLTATAGAAYSLTPVSSATELLRQATIALETARTTNISLGFYDPARDTLGGPAAVVLKSELRAALDDDQLYLHYQPIIHLPSGAPVGMEALLRWNHPTRGLLYASDFTTVLQHSPDHARFIAWQLDRALAVRAGWGDRDLPVSVNLAARCLLDRRFPDQVATALQRAGVPGHQLMVEIDETAVLTQLGLVGDVLTRLQLLGVHIAIDSLGTGTSSLITLLKVPATHVKVHGYFVRKMLIDPEAMAVVGMGLDLARRADLQMVATGVSSEDQLLALQQRGCDTAQGPHLVRPLSADEIPDYLATAPTAPIVTENAVVALDSRRRDPTP